MSGLPKGWLKVTYDDVATYTDYVANGSFASLKEHVQYKDEEDFAILVRLKDETKQWRGPFKYVTKEAYDFLSKSSLVPGDLFLVNVGAPGKAFLVPDLKKPMTIAPNGIRVRVKEVCVNKFLYYYVLSPFGQAGLHEITAGNAQQKFNKTHLKKVHIPLAPLNEQVRIADKLDSILAKVDRAQARLDKIPGILKRFRQSVLAAATSGDLTREWRVQNGVLLSDWEPKVFSELIQKIRSGSGLKPSDDEEGIAILRSSAVRNLAIDYSDLRYLPRSHAIKSQDYLANDDLLFTRLSGSIEYVGNCARVQGVKEDSIQYPDRLFCATLKDKDHARYLEIYFSSPKFGQYIASTIKSSAGHQRITIDVLNSAALRLPSIEEQKCIVRMVDELLKKAGAIEKKYLHAKEKVDRLTQSILGNAFTGELVSQDPNDEPAEKLLARIKTSNSNAKIKRK